MTSRAIKLTGEVWVGRDQSGATWSLNLPYTDGPVPATSNTVFSSTNPTDNMQSMTLRWRPIDEGGK